jgi:nucleoside-diphosphate-sugar epimerase
MTFHIALTGATGFVGSHTLRIAHQQGMQVRALARRPQPAMAGCTWIIGSLEQPESLDRLVQGVDAVIHVAGVTNALDGQAFDRGNAAGTAAMRAAAGGLPFVQVSSLAAREPQLSLYGASKRAAERAALAGAGRVTIVRPPAVYGPGDRELLAMFVALQHGVLPLPAGTRASMIHVEDLACALVALAAELAGPGRTSGATYEIDDGSGGYAQAEIARRAAAALGRRAWVPAVPPAVVRAVAWLDTRRARRRGSLPRLGIDRARYLVHPDWTADSAPLRATGLWQPRIALDEGLRQTVAWYRAEGLLR